MNLLSEYDNNYITLISILQKWAERLYAGGFVDDSKSVLEFAISLKSDVARAYRLLAEIYTIQYSPEKIEGLIHIVSDMTVFHDRDKLILDLKEMLP
jgi:hypothetical protein